MLLFTNKARHVIETAVQRLPDEGCRSLWVSWAKENSQMLRPGGFRHDQGRPPDVAVVKVVLSALERLEASVRDQMDSPALSEDQISDLENDLTYIVGLSQLWQQMPAR